ncbi:glycerol kinase [Enterococcus sp. JM4C]|uniref:FGGY-family carbohydrate kinase n=1 Tax=Candidatus Enterococcus huntleyi TaxID=1857217 RepID=UPI00137A4368|nr:FGGY family carbohydrate kinase [Enterococcus sp. JM4C]KAF1299404.1 glycerol kinase [Enterococcus sp. JM4C]
MNNKIQLIIDQGTSGTKLLKLKNGEIVSRKDMNHRQMYPNPGWVEHDADEIFKNVKSLLDDALKVSADNEEEVVAISITNQRETIIAWDKMTGRPLYNAIVWQCNRSSQICDELVSAGKEQLINDKTGLRLDTYFSGTKIKWLMENVPLIQEKLSQKKLAIGTMDTWLIWNLTDKQEFVTEGSNASRTLLYDINERKWDDDLVKLFGITLDALPEVKKSDEHFGFYKGIPIIGVLADSQGALLGELCKNTGDVKITMGTGCSIMMQVGAQNTLRDERILSTTAWELLNEERYALEGIIRTCGDGINWYAESFLGENKVKEFYQIDLLVNTNEQVYFIPALQGLAAPFWNKKVTAAFFGMKRSTPYTECMRAVLESTIFQIKAVIDVMEEVAGRAVDKVYVDGGMTKNKSLMELLATLLNKQVVVGEIEEYSALGAASLVGLHKIKPDSKQQTINPTMDNIQIRTKYQSWKTLVEQVINIDLEV